jgi:superfamily II DNA/RNA helicase
VSSTFVELGVPADLADRLARRGIAAPFAIQAATIPDGLAGRDVCGKAPTGSGKTIAFGIPIMTRVGKARSRRPRALVLVPTRELASQVAKELRALGGDRGRTVAVAYGGAGYGPQRTALRSGADVLVACPGRLEDLIQQGDAILDEVDIVVVDEADRMADMGFLPAVKRLLDAVRPDRQTLLFSATLDGEIDVLVKRYQKHPVRHELVEPEHEKGNVTHEFWRAERNDRIAITAELVGREWPAIVFTRTKHGADRLARQLTAAGVHATAIHGNRSQGQRERALADFAAGKAQVLVATDVAARGIHVDSVGCVVHFDPPADAKDYTHRSGRTGRAGQDGLVVSMVGGEVAGDVRKLQRTLGLPQQLLTPPGARAHSSDQPVPTRPERSRPKPTQKPRVDTVATVAAGRPTSNHRSRSHQRPTQQQARQRRRAPR